MPKQQRRETVELPREEYAAKLVGHIIAISEAMTETHRTVHEYMDFSHYTKLPKEENKANTLSQLMSELYQDTSHLAVRWADLVRMLELLGWIEPDNAEGQY